MKFTVIGLGYVGLANSVMLAKYHSVIGVDLNIEKLNMINEGQSPIKDILISEHLPYVVNSGNFETSNNIKDSLDSDYFIIATPTNYDELTNSFDTKYVDMVVEELSRSLERPKIVIKSTIPVGHTELLRKKYNNSNIYFSPEFLREGKALYDNLYPSRIIVGGNDKNALEFASILKNCCLKNDVEILITNPTEAEAVKLFSNTYLAMRVSFFNELDSYALSKGLNSLEIIKGVSLDPRVGDYYNNPSFGYGGYCLPKDTKQLLANYSDIPQHLITATVESNNTRKKFIFDKLLDFNFNNYGIYRLIMKSESDNFRESAVFDLLSGLVQEGKKVYLYEPYLNDDFNIEGVERLLDFNDFIEKSDLIIANRIDSNLVDIKNTIFTRDIFSRD